MKFEELTLSLTEEGWKDVAAAAMLGLSTLKGANAQEIHTVRSGENLSKIAAQHQGVSVQDIAKANNIKNINLIKVGQKLIIPDSDKTPTIKKAASTGGASFDQFKQRIKEVEGSNNFNLVKKIHRVKQGDPTIGWGHSLNYDNGVIAKVLKHSPERYEQGYEISEKDAETLLNYDLTKRIEQLNRIFPDFNNYSAPVQITLMDMLYRGDMIQKNSKALRNGDVNTVIQYLERTANAKASSEPGVTKRLRGHIPVLKQYKNDFK